MSYEMKWVGIGLGLFTVMAAPEPWHWAGVILAIVAALWRCE